MKIEIKFKNKIEREALIAALIHGIYAIASVSIKLHDENVYIIQETDTGITNPIDSNQAALILNNLKEALLNDSGNCL